MAHAILGCLGASASGGKCGAGASGSGLSVALGLILGDVPKTIDLDGDGKPDKSSAEDKNERVNLVNSLTTALAYAMSKDGGQITSAVFAANAEVDNNQTFSLAVKGEATVFLGLSGAATVYASAPIIDKNAEWDLGLGISISGRTGALVQVGVEGGISGGNVRDQRGVFGDFNGGVGFYGLGMQTNSMTKQENFSVSPQGSAAIKDVMPPEFKPKFNKLAVGVDAGASAGLTATGVVSIRDVINFFATKDAKPLSSYTFPPARTPTYNYVYSSSDVQKALKDYGSSSSYMDKAAIKNINNILFSTKYNNGFNTSVNNDICKQYNICSPPKK